MVQPFRPEGFHKSFKQLKESGGNHSAVAGKASPDPGICEDYHERCQEWADAGECTKNPGYMKGEGSDQSGTCRKACQMCTMCTAGDRDCYRRNREIAGYLDLSDEVRQLMHH